MKIKYQVPRGLRPENKKRRSPYHWWLVEKPTKKQGRLAQLNKRNTKRRTAALPASNPIEGSES